MKTLLALIASTMMLNQSVHAGSSTKFSDKTPPDAKKNIEGYESDWQKQEMEDIREKGGGVRKGRDGFEKNPYPYRPKQPPEERIQTED